MSEVTAPPMAAEIIRLDGTYTPGQILRFLRIKAGLSRPQLAARVSARTGQDPRCIAVLLSRWESGRVRSPDEYALNTVMKEFGLGLALVSLAEPA